MPYPSNRPVTDICRFAPHSVHRSIASTTIAALALMAVGSACHAQTKTTARSPTTRTDTLSPALRTAVQRDLGVMPDRLMRIVQTQREAGRRRVEAQRALHTQFAGAWLERTQAGDTKLVVGVTSREGASKARALGFDAREMTYSLDTLELAHAALDRPYASRSILARRVDPAIHAWYVDLPRNRVVVEIDPGAVALAKARSFVAAGKVDPALIRFVAKPTRPRTNIDPLPLRGGGGYSSAYGFCSIGFTVLWGNQTGFLTAGHCAPAGASVSGSKLGQIGHVHSAVYPGADHAWVRRTSNAWYEVPSVTRYAFGSDIGIVGSMEAMEGAYVCASGRSSRYKCGTIRNRNVSLNYVEGPVFNMISTSTCSAPGDSGGPLYTLDGEAQGVHSGNESFNAERNNCVDDPQQNSYYQPVIPALAAHNLTLNTTLPCGRLNPHQILAAGSTIESCNKQYRLVQQADGNLVLYGQSNNALWRNDQYGGDLFTHLQHDGNFVTYNSAGQHFWHTRTNGNAGATLFVQDDGNLVIYSASGRPLWDRFNGNNHPRTAR